MDSDGGRYPEGISFIPIGEAMCLFEVGQVKRVRAIVYNLYLYTEDDIFVESFAHQFRPPATISDHMMHTPLVHRSVEDVFPRVGHLSADAKNLSIWQFAD